MLRNKNIGIYLAIANHYSLLDTILKSIKVFDCRITLFIDKALGEQYGSDPQVTDVEYISQTRFITKAQLNKMNQQHLVIFDELTSFKELLGFAWFKISIPHIMIVHDCNTWFAPVKPAGLKNLLKYRFTQILRKKFKVFAVAGPNMKRYVKQNFPAKDVFLIPFRYADFDEVTDATPQYVPGQRLRICVPGTVSKRRDYNRLIDNLCTPELKDAITLDILGHAVGEYGNAIIKRLRDLKVSGYDILFAESYVSNDRFDQSIKMAHVILSDFDRDYITNNGQHEVYGLTKETGVPVLMLNKAKVGIMPATFNQMQELADQTLFFKDKSDLTAMILSIYDGSFTGFDQLQQNAVNNARAMDVALISAEVDAAYNIQVNAN